MKKDFLRTGQRKTVIWHFMFSIRSIMAIVKDYLTWNHKPYEYVMTYKFSQGHIELLINKIQRRGGWNNNLNVLEFKYALHQMIIKNSIQPSKTGNCTSFEDSLSDSTAFLDISRKCKQIEHPVDNCQTEPETRYIEGMLIEIDQQSPNDLKDNILYYIVGFIFRSMLPKLECVKCKRELLLDPTDPTASNMVAYQVYAKFTHSQKRGGLILPYPAVLKIVKSTKVIFKRRVVNCSTGITREKILTLKLNLLYLNNLDTMLSIILKTISLNITWVKKGIIYLPSLDWYHKSTSTYD